LAEKPGVYEELERKVALFADPVIEHIRKKNINASLQRVGSMLTLFLGTKQVDCMEDAQHLDKEWFARFFRYMFEQGIYIPPVQHEAWFISAVHTDEHLLKTRDAVIQFL
jgi:glutamate-1-semialdehyde 2,1-aminomutase